MELSILLNQNTMSNEEMENKTVQEAPTEQTETKQDVQPAPVEQSEESKPEIDYVAELDKAKAKLEKAGNTIEKIKKENKELKTDDDDEYIDYQEEIDKQVAAKVAEKMDSVRTDLASDTIESTLENLSANPDERALIKHHYNNSLKSTGFSHQAIMQDLQNARLLANRQTLSKENTELKAALTAKASTGNSSRGANLDKANIDKPIKPMSEMTRAEHKAYWESLKK